MKIKPFNHIKVSKTKIAAIHRVILDELGGKKGEKFWIPYIPNAETVLLFNPNTDPEKILASLEVLRQDILVRIHEEKEG